MAFLNSLLKQQSEWAGLDRNRHFIGQATGSRSKQVHQLSENPRPVIHTYYIKLPSLGLAEVLAHEYMVAGHGRVVILSFNP